jgi:hypothetical protein
MSRPLRLSATSLGVTLIVVLQGYLVVAAPVALAVWLGGLAAGAAVARAFIAIGFVYVLAIGILTHVRPFSNYGRIAVCGKGDQS